MGTKSVPILYREPLLKRAQSSNIFTFIKFGHALVVVFRTGWARF